MPPSALTARFVRHDSTEENLKQLRSYIVQHGRPVSVYTDKASLFQVTPRVLHHRDAPEQQLTQIGRALQELNIEWIAAHSPQAKGRIERAFQTAQDRLVKGLRQLGAKDLETANAYLEQVFLPLWNRRFRRPAAIGRRCASCAVAGNESGLSAEHSGKSYRGHGLHASLGGRALYATAGGKWLEACAELACQWSDGWMEAGGCSGGKNSWHWNCAKPGHGWSSSLR